MRLTKGQKIIALVCVVLLFGALAAGCGEADQNGEEVGELEDFEIENNNDSEIENDENTDEETEDTADEVETEGLEDLE